MGDREHASLLERLIAGWDAALRVGFEAAVEHDLAAGDDLFMVLAFGERMGLSNPAAWHTLELYPYLLEAFHEWHLRAGMDHSPLDHVRCC